MQDCFSCSAACSLWLCRSKQQKASEKKTQCGFILLFLELQFLCLEKIIPLSLSFRCLLTSTVVLWLCGIARGWGKRDQKKAKPIQGISLNIRRLRVTFFFFSHSLGWKVRASLPSSFFLFLVSTSGCWTFEFSLRTKTAMENWPLVWWSSVFWCSSSVYQLPLTCQSPEVLHVFYPAFIFTYS